MMASLLATSLFFLCLTTYCHRVMIRQKLIWLWRLELPDYGEENATQIVFEPSIPSPGPIHVSSNAPQNILYLFVSLSRSPKSCYMLATIIAALLPSVIVLIAAPSFYHAVMQVFGQITRAAP